MEEDIKNLREALLTSGEVPPGLASAGIVRAWNLVKSLGVDRRSAVDKFISAIQQSNTADELLSNVNQAFAGDRQTEEEYYRQAGEVAEQTAAESARTGRSPADTMSSPTDSFTNGRWDFGQDETPPTSTEDGGGNIPPTPPLGVTHDSPRGGELVPVSGEGGRQSRVNVEGVTGPTPDADVYSRTDSILERILEALLRIEKGVGPTTPSEKEEQKQKKDEPFDWSHLLSFVPSSGAGANLGRFGQQVSGIIGGTFRRGRNLYRRFKSRSVREAKSGGSSSFSEKVSSAKGSTPTQSDEDTESGLGGILSEGVLGSKGGLILSGATVFAGAVAEFSKATYAFTRAQEDEIRRLSQVGGQQAVGIAELDVGRTLRDIQTAQETGGSSRNLTDSLNRFEQTWQKIESLLMNIANTVGSDLLNLLNNILSPIASIAKDINELLDFTVGRKDDVPGQNIFGVKIDGAKDIVNMGHWPGGPAGGPGAAPPDPRRMPGWINPLNNMRPDAR